MKKKHRILYLGSFPPPSLIDKTNGRIDSLYRDDLSIVLGLRNNPHIDLKVITAPDIESYPKNILFLKKEYFEKDDMLCVSCLNVSVIKQIWIILALLVNAMRILRGEKGEYTIIIPYVVFHHVVVGYILKRLYSNKVRICTIIPDVFFPSGFIRRFLNRKAEEMTQTSDYYVFYSNAMIDYYHAKGKPYIIIEGFQHIMSLPINNKNDTFDIVYSGSLNERYGVMRLVKCLEYLPEQDIRLHLYGSGDAIDQIIIAAEQDSRINYHGKITKQDAVIAIHEADVLINPRSENDGDFVRYSFPSKDIEYLGTGIPTILCKLSSMPQEYYPYFIDAQNGSIDNLVKAIIKVHQMPRSERDKFGATAKAFICERMNIDKQAEKIIELINYIQ